MRDKTRNEDMLASFVEYCEAHPELRFWQALRNWSGRNFVLVATSKTQPLLFEDTFYWEGRDK